ncbi:hypothetical protein BCR42DRAFT_486549 [Absidia repens]|uniref:C3H1-type domain-containing protein n=1 Tax=Absidia repens TaxID=90262 RepID=A0A1X2IY34_9FUNG|nr:hypothetical protein BCR42DRAFT_486549 [Absidia repens]
MDSVLNSAMEAFEVLSLGPIELVVLLAVIVISLCYLFSKVNAPANHKVNNTTRSINNSTVCQKQRGINDQVSPSTVDRSMLDQALLNPLDNSSTGPSSDDHDEHDKFVPDFLSDASSTTTDSDATAVGTAEHLSTKEQHAAMDDNADLVDEKTRTMDVKPTTNNASQNKSQGTEQDKQEDESDNKMACSPKDDQPIDRHIPTSNTLSTDSADEHAPVRSMDPLADTQQTALQSVTENLDDAETDQLDVKNTNDVSVCNPAVIPESGATKKDATDADADNIVGEDEEHQSRTVLVVDTNDYTTPAPPVDEGNNVTELVDTMKDTVTEPTQPSDEEATMDLASQRLDDGEHNDNPSIDAPTTESVTVEEVAAEIPSTTTEPVIATEAPASTVMENSGVVACDQDMNTAELTSTTHTGALDVSETEVIMTTTTRSVTIGLDSEKEEQKCMDTVVKTDDVKKINTCLVEESCTVVAETLVDDCNAQVKHDDQVCDETSTMQSNNTGMDNDDYNITTRGIDNEENGQCTNKDTSLTIENILPQMNPTIATTMDVVTTTSVQSTNTFSHSPTTLFSNPTNKPKQDMSRIERIGQQRQPYIPLYKSRCTFWPGCTNNHCKYYHPFIECRNGKTCEFGKKCVFLHPKDYNDYQKHVSRQKKNKSNSDGMNGKKQQKQDTRQVGQLKMEENRS